MRSKLLLAVEGFRGFYGVHICGGGGGPKFGSEKVSLVVDLADLALGPGLGLGIRVYVLGFRGFGTHLYDC